jgi:Zn ribbon nucleic-acid-binding protein
MAVTGLGNLCKRGHDHENGQSLRYIHKSGKPIGNCVECGRENGEQDRDRQHKVRKYKAVEQGRFDNKYVGSPCRLGHLERYVLDGSCVECETERRRKRAKDPDRLPIEKARKDRDNEKRSIERAERAVDRALRAEGFDPSSPG